MVEIEPCAEVSAKLNQPNGRTIHRRGRELGIREISFRRLDIGGELVQGDRALLGIESLHPPPRFFQPDDVLLKRNEWGDVFLLPGFGGELFLIVQQTAAQKKVE